LFNYIIKIYGDKIKHQPKNKNLFEIVITLNRKKKTSVVYFPTNPILKDKIKKNIKNNQRTKNQKIISG
jgi:hypothetical protein